MRACCWNGCRLWVVFICLILAAGCAKPVRDKSSGASALGVAEISNGSNQANNLSWAFCYSHRHFVKCFFGLVSCVISRRELKST